MLKHYRPLPILYVFLAAALVFIQTSSAEYMPQVGQPGRDVVWVPTPQALVDKMMELARVTSEDYVIDLGSGDGRTVIAAAKRGARAVGIEYNTELVGLAQKNALKEGVADKAHFIKADLFTTDLSRATVITMFLLSDINLKLRQKLLSLKPGTRIVSNTFDLGEWKADQKVTVQQNCASYCTAYLWIVPARVKGIWSMPQGEIRIKQQFQKVWGTLKTGAQTLEITEGLLNGETITFKAGNQRYAGKVNGDSMEGTVTAGKTSGKWSATRKSGSQEWSSAESIKLLFLFWLEQLRHIG